MKRDGWLGLAALALIVLAGGTLFLLLRIDHDRGYSLPPWQFIDQARNITIGMSKEQAFVAVEHFTNRQWRDDEHLIFELAPTDTKGLIVRRTHFYIHVDFKDGKVAKVATNDG